MPMISSPPFEGSKPAPQVSTRDQWVRRSPATVPGTGALPVPSASIVHMPAASEPASRVPSGDHVTAPYAASTRVTAPAVVLMTVRMVVVPSSRL